MKCGLYQTALGDERTLRLGSN